MTAGVAVVGMGIAVPGAGDPDELWKLLRGGRPVFGEPADRYPLDAFWSADPAAEDRCYTRTSGFLHDFRPHPVLAGEIAAGVHDEADRTALWLRHCLLQARTDVAVRATDRYAYYVGTSSLIGDRAERAVLAEAVAGRHTDPKAADRLRSLVYGGGPPRDTLPDRIARSAASGLLPADCEFAVVDAACSSSLYTIGLGVLGLLDGSCDLAVCGGVSAVTPRYNVTFAKLRGLSPGEDVRVFDERADGTLFSDGAGVVVLKLLERAVEDGDPVLGVLLGFGGSSDGRGTAIYAPNPVGQSRCLERARRAAGVSADDVDWVLAHGTGTSVGDAVELRTLAGATGAGGVWCGSNKSLLGHSAWSSGVVSVIEALTALWEGAIPAQARFTSFGASAPYADRVRVPVTDVPWPEDRRRARVVGVSAFGFGGTNGHLLIADRAEVPTSRPVPDADPVVVLAWTAHLPGDPGPGEVARWLRGGVLPGPRTFGDRYPAPPFPDVRLPPPTVRATDAGQLMALRVTALFGAEHGELWDPVRATTGVVAAASGPQPSASDNLVRCHAAELDALLEGADRAAFAEYVAGLRAVTPPTTKDTLPGILPNVVAARIANRYDLGGVTMLVDSGFTAVHVAARQLAHGELDMALVLGVSANSRPEFARFMGLGDVAEGAFLLALARESVARAHGLVPLTRLGSAWQRAPRRAPVAGETFAAADGVLAVLRALHADAAETSVGPADGEPGPVITLRRQTRSSR
ncbi:polyketide synthase [Streptomyces acidiscabies]|uniref:Beta-ketoacyl synthase N-terminal-like domain-containing protein n=1 Tax=Streptomyces acidiscabies TaxID=42234 RepID=A0AAP6EIB0_9ACTN|nr:polyketide synthase [Streptomyces acidiscabies]MBP5941850.1 beta-ketoacyl synthase [Streptomyces sp. LBUM 1476]MBZ3913283.1 beta-ketoacyl synthase [Streptomyces acidiscabies]MDX2963291.1 beta-ketoacyl synthase N-terminal-like domain-containing protein [Streptomyces acidiscabies]MDX3021491.1 beta-ketoacyl synthase N-terminal-like domain-containing protein [Streptomyces acidiscabies]MDX3790250.1 beta-ketoacyl synthase N-terminal-like domain-containing protein [Streptomyces acidiscabies]